MQISLSLLASIKDEILAFEEVDEIYTLIK